MARRRQGIGRARALGWLGLPWLCLLPQTGLNYPPTRREPDGREVRGTLVEDPYRWLEETGSAEVRDWLCAQTELAASFLAGVGELEATLRPLVEAGGGATLPRRGGERLFFVRTERTPLGELHELCVLEDGAEEARVLLGPDAPELAGLIDLRPSPDGAHVALASPADPPGPRAAWRVLEVEGRSFLPKGAGAALSLRGAGHLEWLPAGDRLLVVLHEDDGTTRVVDPPLDARLGDAELFREPSPAGTSYELDVSPDGRYAVLTATQDGVPGSRILVFDHDEPRDGFRRLFEVPGVPTSVVHVSDGLLWLRTELGATRGRIVEVDLTRAEPDAWGELVAEREELLLRGPAEGGAGPRLVGGRFVLPYRSGLGTLLRVLGENGELQQEIALPAGVEPSAGAAPGAGSSWLAGTFDRPELFVRTTGPAEPGAVLRFDLEIGARRVFHRPALPFDPEAFAGEAALVPVHDGARVPLTLLRRRDRAVAGPLRTWLVVEPAPATASYQARLVAFLQAGGLVALARVRGGEHGAALLEPAQARERQLAIDDVLAVAEWLAARELTTPSRLAVGGTGGGGLVVAAALLQRPALFGAALLDFAPLDVLWLGETPDGAGEAPAPDDLAALRAVSPYHNLRKGSPYPPVLVTTSEGDPRLGQAAKFVAALQFAQSDQHPALLEVAWGSGAGSYGSPQRSAARTWAVQLAFLEKVLE